MQFIVHARLSVSVFKVVEAASEDEARSCVESLGTPSLCAHCVSAGVRHAQSWGLSDGLDGEAEIVEVERV